MEGVTIAQGAMTAGIADREHIPRGDATARTTSQHHMMSVAGMIAMGDLTLRHPQLNLLQTNGCRRETTEPSQFRLPEDEAKGAVPSATLAGRAMGAIRLPARTLQRVPQSPTTAEGVGTRTRTTGASTPFRLWLILPPGPLQAPGTVVAAQGDQPPASRLALRLVLMDGSRVPRWPGDTHQRCNPPPDQPLEEGDGASSIRAPMHQLHPGPRLKIDPGRDLTVRHPLPPSVVRLEPQLESIRIDYPKSHPPVLMPAGLRTVDTGGLPCTKAQTGARQLVDPVPDHRPVTSPAHPPARPTLQ